MKTLLSFALAISAAFAAAGTATFDDLSLAPGSYEDGQHLNGSFVSGERMTQSPGLSGWLVMAYLVVFGSIVAFSSYMYLLKNVRPAAATSYCYVNPAVAVLLGVLFAGEHIGWAEGAAMAVIISAVVLIGLPQWRKQKPV